jgi:hypothetical protein
MVTVGQKKSAPARWLRQTGGMDIDFDADLPPSEKIEKLRRELSIANGMVIAHRRYLAAAVAVIVALLIWR